MSISIISRIVGGFNGSLIGAVSSPFIALSLPILGAISFAFGGFQVVQENRKLLNHLNTVSVKEDEKKAHKEKKNAAKWRITEGVILFILSTVIPVIPVAIAIAAILATIIPIIPIASTVIGAYQGAKNGFFASFFAPLQFLRTIFANKLLVGSDEINNNNIREARDAFDPLIDSVKNANQDTFNKIADYLSKAEKEINNEIPKSKEIYNNDISFRLYIDIDQLNNIKQFTRSAYKRFLAIPSNYDSQNISKLKHAFEPFNPNPSTVEQTSTKETALAKIKETIFRFSAESLYSHGKSEHRHADLAGKIYKKLLDFQKKYKNDNPKTSEELEKVLDYLIKERVKILQEGKASLGGNFMRMLDAQIDILEQHSAVKYPEPYKTLSII